MTLARLIEKLSMMTYCKHNLRKLLLIQFLSIRRRCKYSFASKMIRTWQIHEYGDVSSNLKLIETPMPVLQDPNDILIKVKAASINPIDGLIAGGYGKVMVSYMNKTDKLLPLTPGRDFAGTIVEKGQEVGSEFQVGDAVYGALPLFKPGTLSEFILCNKSMFCQQPKNVSASQAASIAYAAMTAWNALFVTGNLKSKTISDCKILILGASGGVGTVAVQMLKAEGATAAGTCSANAVPMVQSLGADYVFDYNDENYILNVGRIGKFEIILDCAKFGYQNVPSSWQYKQYITLTSPLLLNCDRYGFYGGLAVSFKDIVSSNFTKFFQGKSVKWGFFSPNNEGLKFITKLLEEGKINPVVHKVFKFSEVPQAFAAMAEGHLRGKIVIDFD